MTIPDYSERWAKEIWALQAYWRAGRSLDAPQVHERRRHYGNTLWQYALIQEAESPTPDLKVLFFHGGAWTFGRPERFRHHGHAFIREDLDCVLPSVRRIPLHHGRHIREDLVSILKLLDEQFGTEVKWIVGGVSSGGHLATLLATDPSIGKAANWDALRFAGLMVVAPPLDLEKMPRMVQLALKRGETDASSATINPIRFVERAPHLEVLLIQSQDDPVVQDSAVQPWIEARVKHFPQKTEWLRLAGKGHIDLVKWSFPDHELQPAFQQWVRKIKEAEKQSDPAKGYP